MTKDTLRKLLNDYKRGRIGTDVVMKHLSSLTPEPLGFATIDHHRELRQGFPEVILCEGKTAQQVASIAGRIARRKQPLLATRATSAQFAAVHKTVRAAHYHPDGRTITANEPKSPDRRRDMVLVVTAGTSDIPVAEEAAITAMMFGSPVERLYDVGVAGLHRLLSQSDKLMNAAVIIVVAGMEGALPSVVGGLVDVPVIAVPTSIGYGASFQGVAALLAMLNSCASGITVVNIDNGFGAGFAASLMNKRSR
ncbi:MAG TPA: nickel pincer cofactor biosynthesis protein LarB [Bacteroidota bacterium]|nr:nickel pincer cofactor biosynthesis protein LarB [Bacteroidota bacterium]